ncbi:hypothetical protein [Halobacillus sp. A5]|nr:hypothetical protein [Halobacillus sp. A5]MCP3026022.1 hypothetical protein [Halobacillus sp. A5]
MGKEVEMSECVHEIDYSHSYTFRDKALELLIDYINETSDFRVEKNKGEN